MRNDAHTETIVERTNGKGSCRIRISMRDKHTGDYVDASMILRNDSVTVKCSNYKCKNPDPFAVNEYHCQAQNYDQLKSLDVCHVLRSMVEIRINNVTYDYDKAEREQRRPNPTKQTSKRPTPTKSREQNKENQGGTPTAARREDHALFSLPRAKSPGPGSAKKRKKTRIYTL